MLFCFYHNGNFESSRLDIITVSITNKKKGENVELGHFERIMGRNTITRC